MRKAAGLEYEECGDGEGLGFNCNLPLNRGTADDDYANTLSAAIERIRTFDPGALVVALGLDAYLGDPLRGLAVTTGGFGRIGEQVGTLRLPTVIVQEGGYLSDALGDNLAAFLAGFRTATSLSDGFARTITATPLGRRRSSS